MALLPTCPKCGHPEHDGDCLFPRTEVVLALDSKDSEIEALRAQAKEADERATELESLFDAQQARVEEATRRWQEATGNYGVLPDLGRLVQWLMDRADEKVGRMENGRSAGPDGSGWMPPSNWKRFAIVVSGWWLTMAALVALFHHATPSDTWLKSAAVGFGIAAVTCLVFILLRPGRPGAEAERRGGDHSDDSIKGNATEAEAR